MRILTSIICLLVVFGCSSNNDKKAESDSSNGATSQPTQLEPIERAIPNPEPSEKKPFSLGIANLKEAGIEFNIKLPEGYMLSNEKDFEGVRVSANEDRFALDIYETNLNYQGIMDYWQSNPEDFTFRRLVVDTEDGIVVEVEQDGKANYHVDYLFQWEGKTYRLISALNKSFSEYDAAQMFNVGRTVKALNR